MNIFLRSVKIRHLKSVLATVLSLLMAIESVPAAPIGSPATAAPFSIALPGSLGCVTDSYSPRTAEGRVPDFILISRSRTMFEPFS